MDNIYFFSSFSSFSFSSFTLPASFSFQVREGQARRFLLNCLVVSVFGVIAYYIGLPSIFYNAPFFLFGANIFSYLYVFSFPPPPPLPDPPIPHDMNTITNSSLILLPTLFLPFFFILHLLLLLFLLPLEWCEGSCCEPKLRFTSPLSAALSLSSTPPR